MCGICGYVNTDGTPIIDQAVLRRMMEAIRHRGPDDEGSYTIGSVALGHRRLSIIDLEKGHQPIFDEDRALSIVYNGEVYNFLELKTELINRGHVFTTRSDTEVIIKAYREWGDGCLERFNGMFALAIWDGRSRTLFLARDRFGKKPLYYGSFGPLFIFASELKSIYQHPDIRMEIDRLSLAKFFAHDYIPAPRTVIQGILKLEPGHFLTLRDGAVTKRRYWDFTFDRPRGRRRSEAEFRDIFLERFKESVRRRLMSDVPLGVFLSGGIDSSAIVAMMARLMDPRDIKTFSIGFRERTYNEADAADLVARHFNTDHRERILDADIMLKALPKIFDIIDEPFADSSIIPTYMVSSFTREHVKVALGGDGGDELFMGYPSFVAHRIASVYDRMPAFARHLVELSAGAVPGRSDYMSLHFKLSRFLQGVRYPTSVRHQVWIGSFPPHEQAALFRDRGDVSLFDPGIIYDESARFFNECQGIDDIEKIEYLYIKTYLPDDILTKVDRASMATSLEVRAPFLDREIAAFSGGLPHDLKLRGLCTKHLLKVAMKGILPPSIINKPKHGFAVPVGGWFRTSLKGLLLETLDRPSIEREGLFDYRFIKKLLDDHFAGRADHGRKIWALFIYQIWYNMRILRKGNPL